jgi:hypothetical protein
MIALCRTANDRSGIMAIDVIQEHIEIVQGAGGPKVRIAGSRIRVLDVVI